MTMPKMMKVLPAVFFIIIVYFSIYNYFDSQYAIFRTLLLFLSSFIIVWLVFARGVLAKVQLFGVGKTLFFLFPAIIVAISSGSNIVLVVLDALSNCSFFLAFGFLWMHFFIKEENQ